MKLAEFGMDLPALFVVRFTDSVKYIKISDVNCKNISISGTRKIVKSTSDREIVIHVPVADMKNLPTKAANA